MNITMEIQREIKLLRYDVNAEIILSVDASAYSLGAVLFQRSADREIRPVSYQTQNKGMRRLKKKGFSNYLGV